MQSKFAGSWVVGIDRAAGANFSTLPFRRSCLGPNLADDEFRFRIRQKKEAVKWIYVEGEKAK